MPQVKAVADQAKEYQNFHRQHFGYQCALFPVSQDKGGPKRWNCGIEIGILQFFTKEDHRKRDQSEAHNGDDIAGKLFCI